MATSYTSLLGLALPVQGELSGTWGDVVNNYITSYVDAAVAGTQIISGSQTAVTLSVTNGSSLSQAAAGSTGSSQYQIIRCSGNPASLLTITAPAASKVYLIINATSTSQSVKIVGAGPTTGVTIAAGKGALVAWNGSDFVTIASNDASVITGVLAAANGGTGQSSYTTGDILYASGSTALSKLADVATGNALISGGVGVAPSYGKIGLTTHVSGTLPVANGGTGQTSYTDGQLLIGNTTGNTLTKATLTAGSGVTITNGNGSISIAATGSGGTITSVTASSPLASSGGTTPDISFTGTLALTNGGTGKTTAPAAMANLMGYTSTATAAGTTTLTSTSSYYQQFTGTTTQTVVLPVTSTLQTGWTFHIVNNSTGNVTVNSSGGNLVITVLPGTTAMCTCIGTALTTAADWESGITDFSTATGTGSVVLSTSPTLVTPVLGTPTSGTLSNCTVDGTNSVGYLNLPQNAQTGSYTLVLGDAGKHIYHAVGAGAATYTIPANGSVAYPIGTAVTFVNLSSTSISIAITTDTMYLSSAGTTGTRTLAQYGSATALKVTSTVWIISGSGLT